jgi:hypothetical protein
MLVVRPENRKDKLVSFGYDYCRRHLGILDGRATERAVDVIMDLAVRQIEG